MWTTIRWSALALLVFASAASAQQNASITGVVRDTSEAVIPGVTVEASSDALIEKVRTVVTDERGTYRIVDLRPGTYVITFTLPGFSTVRREGIELSQGFTATVNADMRVGAMEETLTVTGASPVVDLQSTQKSNVVNREALTNIPTAEYFAMVANLIPGMKGTTGAGQQDVGGNSGFGSVRMASHGGLGTDQQLYMDGFTINRPNGDGTTVMVPIEGSVQEYSIGLLGHTAEAEAGGVRVNIIPRTGGNRFSGGFYYNFANSSMQSSNVTPALEAVGLTKEATSNVKKVWSFSPSFGGPILQDKLWFYSAYQYTVVQKGVASLYKAQRVVRFGDKDWSFKPDLSRPATSTQPAWGQNVHLTYQLNEKNKFDGHIERDILNTQQLSIASTTAMEAATNSKHWNYIVQGNWSAPVTNRLLLQAGWHKFILNPYSFNPQEDAGDFRITEGATGFNYNIIAGTTRWLGRTDHIKTSMSYITGSHGMKAGMELRREAQLDFETVPTGNNAAYRLLNGVADRVTYQTGPLTREQHERNLGLFAQDRWTINRLTADFGVRFDWLHTSYPEQTVAAAQYRPVAVTFPGATVLDWKDINPRLGIAYDLFGTGKTALKANVSRYVQQETLAITDLLNPVGATNASTARQWTDFNGDWIVQGNVLDPARNGELGPGSNATFGRPASVTTRLDPDFASGFGVRPHQWQFTAGMQQELRPGMALDVTFVRRAYGNSQITRNAALSPSDFNTYCVTAPSDARLPGGGGYRLCDLYDIKSTAVGRLDNVITSASNFGEQTVRWTGFDILIKSQLAHGLLVQGGLNSGKTLTDTCDVVTKIGDATGNPSSLFCRTEEPFQPSFRMSGVLPLPLNMLVSAAFQSNPGPTITAAGTFTNAQISPSLGRNLSSGSNATVAIVEPNTTFVERANQLDIRFAKNFVVQGFRLQGALDLYNALNANPVLTVNNTYGTNGASWLRPNTILSPRLWKVTVRMDF